MTKTAGNILPLALIMTFVVLLSGIAVGTIVLEGLQRARETNDSISAYYMADSGIERELFEIRKNGRTLTDVAALGSDYPNGGTWASTAALEQSMEKIVDRVTVNDFTVIDLFDPDSLGAAANVDDLHIAWTGNGALDVGYAQWQTGGTVVWPSDDAAVSQVGVGNSMNIILDPTKGYRIRVRARDADAEHVVISATKAGVTVPFPGNITLGAEGTFGKATQKITVSMPKSDVLSGVFSYVIFSECQLLKGVPGAPVCP